MNESNNKTLKYVCIGLGAAVMLLLIVVAFLLGQRSGAKKNGANTADPTPAAANDTYAADSTQASATASANDATTAYAQDASTQAAAPQTDAPLNLDISMSAGTLTFVAGDAFNVKFDDSVIVVDTNGDTLTIQNKQRHPSASERRRMDVTVTVPDAYSFNNVDIEMGAGKLIAHTLNTDALDLELGAGSATLDRVVATESATIQEGAGELSIRAGSLANLTLQCGAGATRVSAALTGVSKIDAAVGAVDIDLDGTEKDYTVSFNMGLGTCYFNSEKLARSGSYGDGPNRVDITGGLGVMRVNVG